MTKFNPKEIEFLNSKEEARIATCGKKIPHVKPVSYIFSDNNIWIATDYDTRTFKNLKENPNSAVSIDVYKSGNHQAVLIQGKIQLIENGEEFQKAYKLFFEKFSWVRNDPWGEGEAPFLKLIPKTVKSWGLEK